jgi:hypothetical protein
MDQPRNTVDGAPTTAVMAGRLARTMAASTIGGALGGLVVGGLLGRLAMRLLAATSPAQAQGGITDDQAVVGAISAAGTVALAAFAVQGGAIGGLVLLLARRVLPASRRGRTAWSGLLAGALGGAAFVHGHGSFDFTDLRPVWLAVALFVALPLLYGLAVPGVVDALNGWAHRGPVWLVVPLGVVVLVQPPTVAAALIAYGVALGIATTAPLNRWWQGRIITVAGTALFAVLVAWGLYGLVVDITSLATGTPPTAPLNP